jgi:hypothetical protein
MKELIYLLKKSNTMKKIILSGIFVTALALVALNFYNNSSKEALSDVVKANIEALADDPNGDGDDMDDVMQDTPGDSGGGGGGNTWLTAYKAGSPAVNYAINRRKQKQKSAHCDHAWMRDPQTDGYCWGDPYTD